MHSLLGPQFDAEIAYRQERARNDFALPHRERDGLGRFLARHRRRPRTTSSTADPRSR